MTGRLLRILGPRGRLLRARHPRGGPRLLHGQLPGLAVAPNIFADGLLRIGLLLLQANPYVHQLPAASTYSADGMEV
jgi:hypothetical protein